MTTGTDALAMAFRDFIVNGVPASGPNEPAKPEIRAAIEQIGAEIGAGMLDFEPYETLAAMNADTSQPIGRLGYVFRNNGVSTDVANGFYQWTGSFWEDAAWVLNAVAAAANPLIAQAIADTTLRVGDNTAVGAAALTASSPGVGNTAIGTEALRDNAASGNVAVGNQAAMANTTGSELVALGSGALRGSTSSSRAVAVGADASIARTSGSDVLSIGYASHGAVVSGGDHSIAIGSRAMESNDTGESIGIGSSALTVGTGIRNTVVGHFAGNGLGAGSGNIFVGYNAGSMPGQATGILDSVAIGRNAYTTNSYQVSFADNIEEFRFADRAIVRARPVQQTYFFGNAGNTGTEAVACLAIGYTAMAASASGSNCIAIGARAMEQAATPASSIAIGSDSCRLGTGLIDTVAIGMETLSKATGGVGDVAVGHFALQHATAARNNTGVGDSALRHTLSGEQNVAMGYTVADSNETGSFNVWLGAGCAFARTAGDSNVGIGYRAGADAAGVSTQSIFIGQASALNYNGDGLVAIGHQAARGVTSGDDCVFVGRNAGFGAGQKVDAAGSVVIGAGAVCTRDNEIVIGKDEDTHLTIAGVTFTKAQLEALLALVSP